MTDTIVLNLKMFSKIKVKVPWQTLWGYPLSVFVLKAMYHLVSKWKKVVATCGFGLILKFIFMEGNKLSLYFIN